MMIPNNIAKLLNDQVCNEYFAFYTYQAMTYSLDTQGYKGFSKWFAAQAAALAAQVSQRAPTGRG